MSSRPGIAVTAKVPADGGESPNWFDPHVSVHIRANWPPLATDGQIEAAMLAAIIDAWDAIAERRAR